MKSETFNTLKRYESYMITAHDGDYIRGLSNREIEELIVAGKDLGIIYENNHCPMCLLNFVKKLSNHFYAERERLSKVEAEKKVEPIVEVTKQVEEQKNESTGKKRGRKKANRT